MIKTAIITGTVLISLTTSAQQKEGRVIFQRTLELNISLPGNPEMANALPTTRTDNFELNFTGNIASWKQVEEIEPEENRGGGLVLRIAGSDELNWFDMSTSRRLRQSELGGKNYLVSDSIQKGNWKLTDETKTILGHSCRKAISTVVSRRFTTSMDNGRLERKESPDTSQSVAWFTSDIPVSVGPEIQGQLPGLILELSSRSGKVLYTAVEISAKPDMQMLKEPTKGKKISSADFVKERDKLMEQMQQTNSGPGGNVRFMITQ
ncbi:MAG: GLPGLI family protein [Chitinophagaceae bacterium]